MMVQLGRGPGSLLLSVSPLTCYVTLGKSYSLNKPGGGGGTGGFAGNALHVYVAMTHQTGSMKHICPGGTNSMSYLF